MRYIIDNFSYLNKTIDDFKYNFSREFWLKIFKIDRIYDLFQFFTKRLNLK